MRVEINFMKFLDHSNERVDREAVIIALQSKKNFKILEKLPSSVCSFMIPVKRVCHAHQSQQLEQLFSLRTNKLVFLKKDLDCTAEQLVDIRMEHVSIFIVLSYTLTILNRGLPFFAKVRLGVYTLIQVASM